MSNFLRELVNIFNATFVTYAPCVERDPSVVSVAQLFKLLAALDAHLVLRDSRPDDTAKPDTTPKGSW
jgi:hypothetical protein